jgi:hypothetical protein
MIPATVKRLKLSPACLAASPSTINAFFSFVARLGSMLSFEGLNVTRGENDATPEPNEWNLVPSYPTTDQMRTHAETFSRFGNGQILPGRLCDPPVLHLVKGGVLFNIGDEDLGQNLGKPFNGFVRH